MVSPQGHTPSNKDRTKFGRVRWFGKTGAPNDSTSTSPQHAFLTRVMDSGARPINLWTRNAVKVIRVRPWLLFGSGHIALPHREVATSWQLHLELSRLTGGPWRVCSTSFIARILISQLPTKLLEPLDDGCRPLSFPSKDPSHADGPSFERLCRVRGHLQSSCSYKVVDLHGPGPLRNCSSSSGVKRRFYGSTPLQIVGQTSWHVSQSSLRSRAGLRHLNLNTDGSAVITPETVISGKSWLLHWLLAPPGRGLSNIGLFISRPGCWTVRSGMGAAWCCVPKAGRVMWMRRWFST